MRDTAGFKEAMKGKKIPLLVLDPAWHRLFSIHGKTDRIRELEGELNELLAEQGRCREKLLHLHRLKGVLMNNIIENMDGAGAEYAGSLKNRRLAEDSRLIGEVDEKSEILEERLTRLPGQIQQKNEELMTASMEYCYEKMRTDQREADRIAGEIREIRIALKKNILKKQDYVEDSRQIYSFLHDIFGPQVIDLFDMEYEN